MHLLLLSIGFILAFVLFSGVALTAEWLGNFYIRLVFLCGSWVLWMVCGAVLSPVAQSDSLSLLNGTLQGLDNGLALFSQLFVVLVLASLWRVFPGR